MQVIGPANVVIRIKRKSAQPKEIRSACIAGGGLAGCEAAWQLARAGISVTLFEMRKGGVRTPAHAGDGLAELVCSNSFRSDDALSNAVGLLHAELRMCGSLIMQAADACSVPAGGALAVDRVAFSKEVERAIESHPLIIVVPSPVEDLSAFADQRLIIATGPLTSAALTEQIIELTGREQLAFFDAIAPIVMHDSIDFNIAWKQSRYDKGEGQDYINLPMNEQQYFKFVELLLAADTHEFKEWEKNTPYFNGCLPIEVMAERGPQTLRFGPMKPVGLRNPHRFEQPYAVVQLRQDNRSGTLYNMVGFQTKMNYRDQREVFRTIPGLDHAEFIRLGGIHRNTFINSPALLDEKLRLRTHPHIRFAGQITGVEGYVESAACGFAAGVSLAAELKQAPVNLPGRETAIGALVAHITGQACTETFQPMNINYGLFAALEEADTEKSAKRAAYHKRSMSHIRFWNAQLRSILFNEPGEADQAEVRIQTMA